MIVVRRTAHWEVWAPAKLNLMLEVLWRRSDGYHEIETLMAAVSLYDTMYFRATAGGDIRCRTEWAEGIRAAYGQAAEPTVGGNLEDVASDERNLVVRALRLLQLRSGVNAGAEVLLVKRIPTRAGLGGASSDAASALRAANSAWRLAWCTDKLAAVGAEIGSDVPFFLHASPAVCRGRGEAVTPIRRADRFDVVIVRPPEGLQTAAVYRHVEVPHGDVRSVMTQGGNIEVPRRQVVANQMFNRLQAAACQLTPWIQELARAFTQLPVWAHQMSGSGTAYFAVCRHAVQANHIACRLRQRQLGQVHRAACVGSRH